MFCKPFNGAGIPKITQYFNQTHQGLDIVGGFGEMLFAMDDSIVLTIIKPSYFPQPEGNEEYAHGFGIILQSLNHPEIIYGHWHCQSIFPVKEGDIVKKWQVVALMGNSGSVKSGGNFVPFELRTKAPYPGTHDHLMFWKNGALIDSLSLIDWNTDNKPSIPLIFSSLMIIGNIFEKISNLIKGRQ